jgi:hypothetical protein
MTDYTPMSKGEADEFMVAVVETIEAQPPDTRDRLRLAVKNGLYDVKAAGPKAWVLDVRGIGELIVYRGTPPTEPPSDGGKN